MKVDFDGIQAFVLVAEFGSFQKAADFLHLTQTALTRRIQKLESHLGVRLLDRTTRTVGLTVIGRGFLPQAQKLVTELTAAVSDLKDLTLRAKGDVTIGCIPTMAYYSLPPIIRKYAAEYPDNRVRILDWPASEVTEAVLNLRAEFGLTILIGEHPDLEQQLIMEDPFMLFCRDDHPLAERSAIAWQDLKQHDLIAVSSLSGNRMLLDYHLANWRYKVQGFYEVQHIATAYGLVANGVGTAILPSSIYEESAHPHVCRIPLVDPVIHRPIGLIRRRNTTLSPAGEAFYRMLTEAFKNA
jgi:DNA-binding transcriptional LysR family regulator